MSKSNDNNSLFDSMKHVEFLIEKVMDLTRAIDTLSSTLDSYFTKEVDRVKIADKNSITPAEIRELTKVFKEATNPLGRTKDFNLDANRYRDLALQQVAAGNKVDAYRFASGFANLVGTHYHESRKALEIGNTPTLKNVNKEAFKPIAEELSKNIGLVADNGIYKILSFWGATNKEYKKQQKGLADYLIEGLASNKFIGGAMRDTVRLFGLLGASWLSHHFGKFGSFLGTLLYGVSEAFSGVIINGIVTGIVQGLTNVIMLAMLKAQFGGIGKGIGKIGSLAGRAGVGALGAAIGFGGSAVSFGAAGDSWEKGNVGNAVALGAGGSLLAAGGIASIAAIFAASMAPIAGALLGIGALITAIAGGWKWFKAHQEVEAARRAKFQKELLGYSEKQIEVEEKKAWYEKLWDAIIGESGGPGGGGGGSKYNNTTGSYSGKKSAAVLFDKKRTSRGTFDPTKMSHEEWLKADQEEPMYGSMGEIINLGMMTKRRAEQVIQADIDKKGSKSYYEVVPGELISKGSFRTDLTQSKNGQIEGAYMAKGTTERLNALRAQAKKEGMTVPLLSSGIGSIGWEGIESLPHQYTSSRVGHYSSTADVGDTTPIRDKNGRTLSSREVEALFQRATGYKPKQVLVEDVGTSNEHPHIAGFLGSKVEENLQKAKTINTDKYLMQASNIVKDKNLGGGEDAFYKWMEKQGVGDPNKFEQYDDSIKKTLYEAFLKKRGIRFDSNAKEGKGGWFTYKKDNIFSEAHQDQEIIDLTEPTGNKAYQNSVLRVRSLNLSGGN